MGGKRSGKQRGEGGGGRGERGEGRGERRRGGGKVEDGLSCWATYSPP